MTKHIITAGLYTVITAGLLGIVYPLLITGISQVAMRNNANGQLLSRNGETIGSALIGQPFTGKTYFHSRPSAAGMGYDASASSGSNYGPTNRLLVNRIQASVLAESSATPVPVDLVTASASGLDPDITPAAAQHQAHRIATAHHVSDATIEQLIRDNITPRQFGLLGEPRVNVLHLNLALDGLNRH